MTENDRVRWGILGTARIAETSLLPALGEAGSRPFAVAGRERDRTQAFAEKHGIDRAIEGYAHLLELDEVEAVYIPLPNSLHAEWAIAALRAGKAVLCEKPLCGSVEATRALLQVAKTGEKPLWEAFVFPFARQFSELAQLLASGLIGEVREIHSEFHFQLRNRNNIRLDPALGGGSLNDVGCYPIRFAQLIFGSGPTACQATARMAPEGVDEEMQGVFEYQDERRLLFSCGMNRNSGTFTRIIGTDGELRVTNPFHARIDDVVEVLTDSGTEVQRWGSSEPTFTKAIEHIDAVTRGRLEPLYTALDDSLPTEVALDLARRSAESGKRERATYHSA